MTQKQYFFLIEIKPTDRITKEHASKIGRFTRDWDRPCHAEIWSLDKNAKIIDGVECLYWEDGINRWQG